MHKISKNKVLKESELIRVKLKGFVETEFNDMFFLYDEKTNEIIHLEDPIDNLDRFKVIFFN
jgi:hypothetical protein